MANFAGIIHPHAYQRDDLLVSMGMFEQNQILRYKNIELGTSKSFIQHNEKKTVWGIFEIDSIENETDLENLFGLEGSLKEKQNFFISCYEQYGIDFIKKIKGIFSLVLFDQKKELLFLVRDIVGKKTLYWSFQNNYFLFSNQLKKILKPGIVSQSYALDGLAAYFYFGYIPQDLTPIKNLHQLLPGYYLAVSLNKHITIQQYFSLSQHYKNKQSQVNNSLPKRIEQIITNYTPQAADLFLSHDPGSLLLAKYHEDRFTVNSYSIHYDGNAKTDFRFYHQITSQKQFSKQEKTVYLPEILNDLVQIIWNTGQPIADPSLLQFWYLAKLAHQNGSKQIVSPIGWECLLPIDPTGSNLKIDHSFGLFDFFTKKKWFFVLLDHLHLNYKYKILRELNINIELLKKVSSAAFLLPYQRQKLSPALFQFFDPKIFIQRFHKIPLFENSQDLFHYFKMKTLYPDCQLLMLEKACNFFGLESFTPFLNQSMIELLPHLPTDWKTHERLEAFTHEPFKEKKFEQFHSSHQYLDSWCKNSKSRHLFGLLQNGILVQENLISGKWIKEQLGYPYLIPSSFLALWSALILEIWFRLYINRPIDKEPSEINLKSFLENYS